MALLFRSFLAQKLHCFVPTFIWTRAKILLFSAGSADTPKSRPQTDIPYVTHVCQKQQQRRYHRQHRSLAYNPFSYIQCSSPTRYPFVAVYSSIGPVFHRPGTRRVLFELNSVSSNWTVERIVCWSGNRTFREFVGLFVFFSILAGLTEDSLQTPMQGDFHAAYDIFDELESTADN